ncbi:MAG: RNA polymerase sigma factor [Dehalococcoidia bacterium]
MLRVLRRHNVAGGGNMEIAGFTSQACETELVEDLRSGDSQLYTWLCSIAFHKMSDFCRRQARAIKPVALPSSIDAMEPGQIEDTEPIAYGAMESEKIRRTVEQAMDSLPRDYRKVLVFKYIQRMPVLEISQLMARSPKSVEGLLSRARKALRASLAKGAKGD